jgi:hypothetical protein
MDGIGKSVPDTRILNHDKLALREASLGMRKFVWDSPLAVLFRRKLRHQKHVN